MRNEVIILRYGELYLKGKNRGYFEKVLCKNILAAISEYTGAELYKTSGRYIIRGFDPEDKISIMQRVSKVFGLHSLSAAVEIPSTIDMIESEIASIRLSGTFKVDVNRADKNFIGKSIELAGHFGEIILNNNDNLKVKLNNPDHTVFVEIRENGLTYIYFDIMPAVGGMPVGTGGAGLLLLSGGIDSPVAGYELARRGMRLSALHFHSFPYTSASAKEKVLTLAKELSVYAGDFDVYIVSFTKIQEAIHKYCKSEYMITIMRRIMFRIAERLARKHHIQAIITGESLAQVASQTVESITSSNEVIDLLPVFRPLIGRDKEDIVTIARNIGTFDTSILPYEDCCTVFLPKHPLIKPDLEKVHIEESKFDYEALIDEALANIEIVNTRDID